VCPSPDRSNRGKKGTATSRCENLKKRGGVAIPRGGVRKTRMRSKWGKKKKKLGIPISPHKKYKKKKKSLRGKRREEGGCPIFRTPTKKKRRKGTHIRVKNMTACEGPPKGGGKKRRLSARGENPTHRDGAHPGKGKKSPTFGPRENGRTKRGQRVNFRIKKGGTGQEETAWNEKKEKKKGGG